MRKLLVTCECGQQMQVPRSAVGKMGKCPTCGATTRITNNNTRPLPGPRGRTFAKQNWSGEAQNEPPGEAKQRFGQAVDAYYAQRYAEALAIFDALAKEFPGNPDIEHGRAQVVRAMRRPTLPPPGPGRAPTDADLNEGVIRRIVLEKLLYSNADAVQLQAADIAAKLLGLYDHAKVESTDSSSANAVREAPEQPPSTDNVKPFPTQKQGG
jgi:hypothetical protein